MKTFKMLLVAALAIFTINVTAQTVDEIVAKNIEAMGGKAKLSTLKTVKLTGAMSVQGADVAITETKSQNAGMRMDIEVMGTSNYQVANATKGSVFMPVFGMAEAQEMPEAAYKSFAAQFDIQGPLLDYKEKGNKVELVGKEKVDGADAYNLKVTYKNGKVSNYFIDANTSRIIKSVSTENVNGEDVLAEITYSDYKQNAGGYWFPYTVTNSRGTISYSTIETNIPVEESVYKN